MTMTALTLGPLVGQQYVLFTSYRRNRTPIISPPHVAVDGDHAFVRTRDTACEIKRIPKTPEVEVAPSATRGEPTGYSSSRQGARGRPSPLTLLSGRRHPVLHGLLAPLAHGLRANETIYVELTPVGREPEPSLKTWLRRSETRRR